MTDYERLYTLLFGKVEDAVNILSQAIAGERGEERGAAVRAFNCLVSAQEACEELYVGQDT
jgi:hypothetical protein